MSTETSLNASASTTGGKTVGTFEVRVSPASDGAMPSGAVTLLEGEGKDAREIASAALGADGIATLTADNFAAGNHQIHAVYRGDGAFAPSLSSDVTLHTEATAAPSYTISANPTSINVAAGVTGTTQITLTPQNGFSQYVGLSCSGLPLATTCSFTPANVSVGAKSGTSLMSIVTTSPSSSATLRSAGRGMLYAFLLPGALGLLGLRFGRSGVLRMMGVLLVAGSVLAGAGACSSRYGYLHYPPQRSLGTPAGTTTVSVQAISVNGTQVSLPVTPLTVSLTVTPAKSN